MVPFLVLGFLLVFALVLLVLSRGPPPQAEAEPRGQPCAVLCSRCGWNFCEFLPAKHARELFALVSHGAVLNPCPACHAVGSLRTSAHANPPAPRLKAVESPDRRTGP